MTLSGYDYIIDSGGGHGLSTAYYLASVYAKNIAVLEKDGWGRQYWPQHHHHRSNYLLIYVPFVKCMALGRFEQDFNYNAWFRNFWRAQSLSFRQQRDAYARRGNAMIMNGADADSGSGHAAEALS